MTRQQFVTLPAAALAFALSFALFSQTVAAPANTNASTSHTVEYVA